MSELKPPAEISAVYSRSERLRPQVTQPNSPWTMVLGLGGVVLLGVVVFTSLNSARAASADAATTSTISGTPAWEPAMKAMLATSKPLLLAQAVTTPPPVSTPNAVGPPIPIVGSPADPPEMHWRAPAMVVDLSDGPQAISAPGVRLAQAQAPIAPGGPPADGVSADERFAARVSGASSDAARATQMRDVTRIVPQGFVIPAVLETAIDSDLPGSVRATVSRDVRGFDGSQVLIPRGSKLIGQYKSAAAIGQTRAFVVWSRIITPTGVSIEVGSPATDRLGRGGLAGEADNHFFQRFGGAILLSVVTGGVDALSRGGSNNTALVIGSPAQAQNVAAIALQKQIDIPTTIRVKQGASVQVSVARDLDFSGVAPVR